MLKEVLDIYDNLNDLHKKKSIPSAQEKRYEENVQALLERVIDELERGEDDIS